jgi:xanthine dehydrogenase accessory factor
MSTDQDMLDLVTAMKDKGEPVALATVVRTVSATAAKPGAKAVVQADGTILGGWIGGGCARAAVLKAARQAIADGRPRLVSIQPMDLLDEQGIRPGEAHDGIEFAKNMCPSHGTMDVFVEPVLPRPRLVVLGASPVAVELSALAGRFGFRITVAASAADHGRFGTADDLVDGFTVPSHTAGQLFVVVATQGSGDLAALRAALAADAIYVAFVGSQRKVEALRRDLVEDGSDPVRLAALKAPAGLDIGAVTPDEIALSIVAEMIEVRRRGHRGS